MKVPKVKHDFVYNLANEGLVKMLERWYKDTTSEKIRQWAEEFMTVDTCPTCEGGRLRKEATYVKIAGKAITELVDVPVDELILFFKDIDLNDFDYS